MCPLPDIHASKEIRRGAAIFYPAGGFHVFAVEYVLDVVAAVTVYTVITELAMIDPQTINAIPRVEDSRAMKTFLRCQGSDNQITILHAIDMIAVFAVFGIGIGEVQARDF